jgi:3-oxoacyl-[acyl-carrier protein] reductase
VSDGSDLALLVDPPTFRLDGRVAWVTGADRGLGRAIAYALAGVGAQLMLSARSDTEIRERGGTAHYVAGSVADPEVVTTAAQMIGDRWGGLDVLVNNAGISPAFMAADRLDDRVWWDVMNVNLFAPFACCRAALPLFDGSAVGPL